MGPSEGAGLGARLRRGCANGASSQMNAPNVARGVFICDDPPFVHAAKGGTQPRALHGASCASW